MVGQDVCLNRSSSARSSILHLRGSHHYPKGLLQAPVSFQQYFYYLCALCSIMLKSGTKKLWEKITAEVEYSLSAKDYNIFFVVDWTSVAIYGCFDAPQTAT